MIRFARQVARRAATVERRLDTWFIRSTRGDGGFVLLESIVVIGLITLVMAAFTTFFVGAITSTNHQRARQAAAQIANSGVETVRSLPVTDLVTGHNRVTAIAPSQTVNNIAYTVASDICNLTSSAATNPATVCASLPPTLTSGANYLQATVTVTWFDPTCPVSKLNPCTYSTSTLLNQTPEPCLYFFQTAPQLLINPFNPSTAVQTWTVGDTRTLQLTSPTSTGSAGFTWSLQAGALPAGLALSPSGLISGSSTAVGTGTATVSIADACSNTKALPINWAVVAPPTVSPTNQTTPIKTIVSYAVPNTCPNAPCVFAAVNLPVGLTINSSNGVVSGTPTIPGTVTVTVTVTDNDGVSATGSFTWSVISPASVCVKSIALPNGGFESPVRSAGADTNFLHGNGVTPGLLWNTTAPDNTIEYWHNGGNVQSANGGLPISAQDGDQWAELNANGVGALYQDLTTVPGQVLQWSVYHRARGVNGNTNDSTDHDVMQVQIGSSASQSAQVPTGQANVNISDGPLAWVHYTGVYTVPAGQTTTRFQFAAITTSSGDQTVGNFIDNLSLNNNIACLVTPSTDQASTVNTPIVPFSITLDRGTGPFTWSDNPADPTKPTLPPGLVISSTGVVSGTPKVVGTFPVLLSFSDATAFAQTVSFNWTVYPKPAISTPPNQTDSVGSSVTLTLTKACSNAPCTYALNNGPPGLTVTGTGVATGTITGSAQVFNAASVTITDSAGATATTATFTWTVLPAPTVTTPANQVSTVGATVNLAVASTCADPACTFTLTGAPPGLSINSSGVITGTPTSAGNFTTVRVTITDVDGSTATTANFTWTVTGPPTISSPGNQTLTAGQAIYFTLSYTCPNGPCTFATANVPPGLSVDNQGNVSGTPTTAGVYNSVTITVIDNSGVRATAGPLTVTVNGPPSAPTSPAATGGTAQIAVSWGAPTNTNGSAITGYTASAAPGGATCNPSPATATNCVISGLQNGTLYTITITATNAFGTGPPSSPVSATTTASCTSVAAGSGGFNAYLAYPLNETGGLVAADVSGNSRPGTYTSSGVTYGAPGPCPRDGGKAVTLNGSTGYISSNAAPVNPQVFSLAIWFKTSVAGGKLIGLGSSKTGLSAQYDRHIYMTNAGTLAFGVYPNSTTKVITTPLAYNNGAWHQVIATLASSTDTNPGMRLYVDGRLVVSDATTTGAEPVSGSSFWRIGYDNVNGWPSAPTNYSFTGSLAFAATYAYAVTPAQALAQYNAGT